MTDLSLHCENCEASARRIEALRMALMTASLHLMVRPHMRLESAEENVKAIIRAALGPSAAPPGTTPVTP